MKNLCKTLVVLMLVISSATFAQVPNKISYQGLLTTSSGAPVQDGSYDLKFDVYNSSLGGTLKHTETVNGVELIKGTFNVILNLDYQIFRELLFIQVTALSGPNITTPITFSPRSELTSSPYSLAPWIIDGNNISYKNGNVIIGEESPFTIGTEKKLTINGNTEANDACIQLNAFWNPEIFFSLGGMDADGKIRFQYNDYDRWSIVYKGAQNALIFSNVFSGTTLYLHYSGRVGFGLIDPTERIDVDGTARLRSIGSSTGTTVVADANGKLWKQSSSLRYKTDVNPIVINDASILELQPVRFKYKETGVEDIGLIAEDVDKISKDLIVYDNEGRPDAVKYDKISLYLLEIIKQQQKEIEELKNLIKSH